MRIESYVIYFLAAICVVTGLLDFIQGAAAQAGFGAQSGTDDPMLDNLIRFFAGIWIGTGILLVMFIRDLERYKPALIALLGFIALGGIGRLISIAQLGFPPSAAGTAIIFLGLFAELVICPVLIWRVTRAQAA